MFQSNPGGTFCALSFHTRPFWQLSKPILGMLKIQDTITRLDLKDERPIQAKPMHFRPEEEAWLDAHLDELTAKGVITPILPHETPRCVTPLLLVPG